MRVPRDEAKRVPWRTIRTPTDRTHSLIRGHVHPLAPPAGRLPPCGRLCRSLLVTPPLPPLRKAERLLAGRNRPWPHPRSGWCGVE